MRYSNLWAIVLACSPITYLAPSLGQPADPERQAIVSTRAAEVMPFRP